MEKLPPADDDGFADWIVIGVPFLALFVLALMLLLDFF